MLNAVPKLLVCAVLLSTASICSATPTITFGPLGSGLSDGTAPFGTAQTDASGDLIPCASETDASIAGSDCGDGNRVIRNQDIASHLWSISVNGGDATIAPGDPVLSDVVIEQTIHPSTNADVSFPSIPAACTVAAGAGTNPPSAIVVNADGSSTLTCNLGGFSEGQARIFTVPVKPSGSSWNGSTYTTTQRVYSVDATTGNSNANVTTHVDSTPITISSAPAYDIVHSISTTEAIRNNSVTNRDVGLGSEPGFIGYMHIRMTADRKTGIESIAQPITLNDTFTATTGSAGGATFPLEFYVTQCITNPTAWSTETIGSENIRLDRTEDEHIVDSGTCAYTRDDPLDPTSTSFTVDLQGADLTGSRYPTRTIGGTDLTAGPYYVMNHRVQIFIPFRSIDLADGIEGNDTGTVYLSSLISDFDPNSPSGTSNYGAETEPGYNGELIDGLRSNNQIGAGEFKLTVNGSFSKRNLKYTDDRVLSYSYSGTSSYHSGDGELESGQSTAGWILVYNNGTINLNNPVACDVFDNSVQQLTDRGDVGATPGTYAFMGTYAPSGHDYTDYQVEYAYIDTVGDDPLDGNHDGTNDYNATSGRYDGDWTKHRSARCDDTSATNGWHTDPANVTGGIDGVNAARAVLSPTAIAAGKSFEPGHQVRFIVPLKARDKFNGGPHDGQSIPVGTVLPNFGGFKSDEWSANWTARNYTPAPESGNVDGDRVTLSRMNIVLDSNSITPYAASGDTASTIAGNQIIWQVDTALQSTIPDPGNAENLRIINELPPEVSYNASCTATTTGGTPAGLIQYNTDRNGDPAPGYTLLTWNFGNLQANTTIAPRIICTDSDPLVEDGTSVINYSEIRADNTISSLAARSDTHTILLEQLGEIQVSKTVDVPLDDRNDSQVYNLAWSNYSAALKIAAPVAIDIFPYNGDNNVPQSSFSGILELEAAPVTTWLDGSTPDTNEQDLGTWYYTADTASGIILDPDSNVSNWCTEAEFNTGLTGCPTNFAGSTAIKFVSNYDLEKDGDPRQGIRASITLNAGTTADNGSASSNDPGDIYTNRFAVDSSTLPTAQFLISPNVSVQVASYAVGDFVFADIDGNGKYDSSVDYTAPDGVVVNLHRPDGTLVKTTTIGIEEPGRFIFHTLDFGDYYVEIPASQFQNDQSLEHWMPSILINGDGSNNDDNGEDDDNNETDDQHAYTVGDPLTNGIRTGIITVTANPAPPGGIPTGNEPIGENVANITDPTSGDDFSNLTLDIGLIPDMYEVTGTVWDDANNNGIRENNESGIAGVTVVMAGSPYTGVPVRCLSVDTDANGFYKFDSVMSGEYQIIESDASDAPFTGSTCPPAGSDPATYVSTTANIRNIVVHETDVTRQDFGDYNGIIIKGTVFDDNGAGSGTSANEDQEGTEPGISGIVVSATDATGTIVYDTTRTATDGSYTLHVPGTITGSVVKVTEVNGNGYVTTGAQVGNTSGSYSANDDTITFTVASATSYTGLDFGDVKKPTFEPNHTGEILPGNVVFYSHTFTATAGGDVTFSRTSDLNTSSGWASLLYRDTNCDGILNGSEGSAALSPTASVSVDAEERVCIIDKVYAPSNVAPRDQYRVTTTASFNYGGSGVGTVNLTVTDTTTAGQLAAPTTPATPVVDPTPEVPAQPAVEATPTTPAIPEIEAVPAQPTVAATPVTPSVGPSRLELRKSVQNITQSSAETETVNQADPGDTLKYTIYYSNTGTGPITDLQVNDTAPAYTMFKLGSGNCDSTPSGVTCNPMMGFDAIEWQFTGTLEGGTDGSVSYSVVIDD
ncbi:SdrD B-like domain-containing protein [Leucothrix arctica]|uniref:SD-repeat containing protein B domain-containing protein n=1 Tax=Leucothrix arctica TaxID=1481894 RepID=A0A317C4G4_9GAMM|nr:SdrD B-like domain-containing protein [Leucothrix arctica]PWQ93576.1 hypothetical protein DKT75_18325 [Leucothrix arctica]